MTLPDFSKTFEIDKDVLDFVIRGVLMQYRNSIAFESCKLNEAERWYTM